ncbi:hypothetical protein V5O48_000343 [Marasmius crinis-equi]|uniref:Uncharacterized protein n=1 Tax=Marasmius crinis-equi TaxID=585013 RepID=A0ABR3G1F3_9AGAR
MVACLFTIRLAIVAYTFLLEVLHPFTDLPISDGIRDSLTWQTSFFTLWNGYFYTIYIIAFVFFFALFALIRKVVVLKMKRNPEFRAKVEKRKAILEVKRAAKAAEDRAKGKAPQSTRMVYVRLAVDLMLTVVMTVNCAVWNRYTDAPTVPDGSLRRFYEMFNISIQTFGLEMAVLAILLPIVFSIKALFRRRRARRNAANNVAPVAQTAEVDNGQGPINEKVLIDLSDGVDYVSEKMNLNQVPYKDEEEGELRQPLL